MLKAALQVYQVYRTMLHGYLSTAIYENGTIGAGSLKPTLSRHTPRHDQEEPLQPRLYAMEHCSFHYDNRGVS